MPVVLGLDLGTTSLTALAIDEHGKVLAACDHENDSAIPDLPAGHAEQNPLRIREMAFHILREVTSVLPEDPIGIGITGQMHGMLAVDANRRPLTNLITWQDRRANGTAPGSSETFLEQILSRCDAGDLHSTGCRLSPGYLGATWHLLREELPSETHQVCLLADWIAAELSHGEIATDPSNAASTGLFDLERGTWSTSLLNSLDLPAELLPPIKASTETAGIVTEETSPPTGLPTGLPVSNAMGDNQAAVLGSVPVGENVIQINVGTGGQISWPVSEFTRLARMDTRYLPVDRLMLVGAGLVGGDAFAWVTNTVHKWLADFGKQLSREELFSHLMKLIQQTPADNDGLTCQPTFRGTRHEPLTQGSFTGITPENFTPGHIGRAVLQGIAAGFYSFYEQAGEHRPQSATRIIGSGNGLRKNPLLAQLIANRFQLPVSMPTQEEPAAWGAALLAGTAVGVWPDLKTAGQIIQHQQIATPNRPA